MSGDIGNFGGFGTENPNAAYIPAAGAVPDADQTGSGSSIFGKSTIEKSQIEAIILLMSAGFPLLAPPQTVGIQDSNSISGIGALTITQQIPMMVEQSKHEIISSMWDSFLNTVKEMAKRAKEEDVKKWTEDVNKNGPKSAAEYHAFLMALSSNRRAEELSGDGNSLAVQFNQTFNNWLVSPSAKVDGVDPSGYPSISFVASSVAANADAVRNAIGAVGGGAIGYQMSVSPVADALFAVGPSSALPIDYQAAAALVTALLNGGAAYKAASDSIKQGVNAAQPIRDLDFALNYAKNIKNIVTHNVESGNNQQSEQNKMMRVMLSAMALVLLYRTTYGGITAEEFASMLNPAENSTFPEEIRKTVQELAILLKNNLSDDPKAKAETLNRLLAYADKNESVDSMLATTRLFSSLLKTSDISHHRLSSDGV